jgi:hypothetical protein
MSKKDKLLEQGVLYPEYAEWKRAGRMIGPHTPFLLAFLRSHPENLKILNLDECRRQTYELIEDFRSGPCHTLLISHESLSQGNVHIDKLASACYGFDVEILVYLRKIDDWLSSYISWHISTLGQIANPDFVSMLLHQSEFLSILQV